MFQFNQGHHFSLKTTATGYAIYNSPNCGPIFGGGPDIYINNEANINSFSHSNIGESYYNALYTKGDADSQARFSGGRFFRVKDYEVWRVVF